MIPVYANGTVLEHTVRMAQCTVLKNAKNVWQWIVIASGWGLFYYGSSFTCNLQ